MHNLNVSSKVQDERGKFGREGPIFPFLVGPPQHSTKWRPIACVRVSAETPAEKTTSPIPPYLESSVHKTIYRHDTSIFIAWGKRENKASLQLSSQKLAYVLGSYLGTGSPWNVNSGSGTWGDEYQEHFDKCGAY